MKGERDWLDSLEVGDRVVVLGGGFQATALFRTVTRMTKTLVIVGQDRFRRDDGLVPGRWGYQGAPSICDPGAEHVLVIREEMRVRRLLREAQEAVEKCRDADRLEAVIAALKGPA